VKNNYKLLAYFFVPFIGIILFKLISNSPNSKTIVLNSNNDFIETKFDKSADGKINFNFDVKPILSDKCYTCHGPDDKARKSDLRLDIQDGFYKSLNDDNDHFVINRADPSKSELLKRISSDNVNFIMPPPESNLKLSDNEKFILRTWIEQGANWESHWSYTKPILPQIPQTTYKQWANNELITNLTETYEPFGTLRRGEHITILIKQTNKKIPGEFLGRLVLGEEGGEVKVFGATIY